MEVLAYRFLIGSAFAAAFSLPLSRALLAVSLGLLIVSWIRERRLPRLPAVAWFGFVFVVLAVVATVFGVRPSLGVPKLRKLLWFVGIPVTAVMISSSKRLSTLLLAYALGCGVLALVTCVMTPFHAAEMVRVCRAEDMATALINTGSMTDAQRLMAGVMVTLGIVYACRRAGGRWGWWLFLLALQGAALVLNFKRGSWICTSLIVVVFVSMKTSWRHVVVLGLVLLSTLTLPAVRSRLQALREEFDEDGGGRITMWTKVAPALIRKHPMGWGYRSLTNRDMRRIAPEVERRRDHLHSNVLQVLVATGWLGLAAYVAWMGRAVLDAARFVHGTRRSVGGGERRDPERGLPEDVSATVLLLLLLGLLANGLVEYNFGDAELVLLYTFVMGSAAAGASRRVIRTRQAATS